VENYRRAVDVLMTAQEILVDNSSYPRKEITQNSHDFRPLGLGYANLGAMLMAMGLPYDSDGGRQMAAAVTSIMTGEAYLQSARMAAVVGAFPHYAENRDPMLGIIGMHRDEAYRLNAGQLPKGLYEASARVWDEALAAGYPANSIIQVTADIDQNSGLPACPNDIVSGYCLGETNFTYEPQQGFVMEPQGCVAPFWNSGVTTTMAGHAAIFTARSGSRSNQGSIQGR